MQNQKSTRSKHPYVSVVLDQERSELQFASIPTLAMQQKLLDSILPLAGTRDVYAAYSGMPSSRFCGFLVTEKEAINQVVAFCPLHGALEMGSSLWRRDVSRQLKIAIELGADPNGLDNVPEVIWLDDLGTEDWEVPTWLYAMACVPLTYKWNGKLIYPRPFCPTLFESMAKQPEAPEWMMRKLQATKADYAS